MSFSCHFQEKIKFFLCCGHTCFVRISESSHLLIETDFNLLCDTWFIFKERAEYSFRAWIFSHRIQCRWTTAPFNSRFWNMFQTETHQGFHTHLSTAALFYAGAYLIKEQICM